FFGKPGVRRTCKACLSGFRECFYVRDVPIGCDELRSFVKAFINGFDWIVLDDDVCGYEKIKGMKRGGGR
ncbi:hypothetical protein, partial [Bacillus licheniformis]|uniref:hypothetical protein n=1 Tax=Bacillus licheniformis TaxID=1402 RepID=UPI001C9319E8